MNLSALTSRTQQIKLYSSNVSRRLPLSARLSFGSGMLVFSLTKVCEMPVLSRYSLMRVPVFNGMPPFEVFGANFEEIEVQLYYISVISKCQEKNSEFSKKVFTTSKFYYNM